MKSLAKQLLESISQSLQEKVDNLPIYFIEDIFVPPSSTYNITLRALRPLIGLHHGKAEHCWYAQIDVDCEDAEKWLEQDLKLDPQVYVGYIDETELVRYGFVLVPEKYRNNLSKLSSSQRKQFLSSKGLERLNKMTYKEFKDIQSKAKDIDIDNILN